MKQLPLLLAVMALLSPPLSASAQSDDANADQAKAEDAEDQTKAEGDGKGEDDETADLLTQAELEKLVAPIALYPDTLLIQILVASTYPLDVVKGQKFLEGNKDTDKDTLKAEIEKQDWDASVAVLVEAFPDVLTGMADHVDWMQTLGDAMLAQDDDVQNAIQTLRKQAINSGALISGKEQTVDTDEDDNVVITPTDPQVVYVPQYDPQVVYVEDDDDDNDALTAALLTFGTFVLVDSIFDDDDHWYHYWGCGNCGGWGGRPIINNPDIDIDIDKDIDIGNGNAITKPGDGWKPDPDKKEKAQERIASKRDENGNTKLPLERKGDGRGDAMRENLSKKTGAADISKLPAEKRDAIAKTHKPAAQKPKVNKPAAKPAAKKPAVKKPAAKQHVSKRPAASRPAARKPNAAHKRAAAPRARAAGNRGGAARGRARR